MNEVDNISAELKIKYISDSLNIDPINTNAICIIVSQDTFKKFYDVDIAETVYIKMLSESEEIQTQAIDMLKGTNVLNLYNQAEDEAELKKSSYVNSLIFIIIFIITTILTAINSGTTVFMRLQLREKEYAMLRAIGLTPSSLKLIITYELLILEILALLLGYILTFIATILMHSYFRRMLGNYMYQFPVEILLPITGFMILVFVITCIPLFKKINNIRIIKMLNTI